MESAEFLGRLERKHRTGPLATRVRMLAALRRRPGLAASAVARLVGVSVPTIERWLARYRRGGLEALLDVGRSGRKPGHRLPLWVLEEMVQLYRSRALASIEEARLWLADRHGIAYSRSRVGALLKASIDSERERDANRAAGDWSRPTTGAFRDFAIGFRGSSIDMSGDVGNLLALLNAAPKSFDSAVDIAALRDALMPLVPAVDRMMIAVDNAFDMRAPETYMPTADLIQHSTRGRSPGVTVRTEVGKRTFSQSILDELREQRFAHDDYHPPHVIELTYGDSTALACILIWRELTKSRLVDRDLAPLELLRPFLESTVATIIVRHQHLRPQERVIDEALAAATKRYHLTHQERRILTYRMLGQSYKQIASTLKVTQDNVKKHLQAVHRKTGTVSLADIFGKLFMPRLTR